MFTTIEQVKELTGYTVDLVTIGMAQNIIETFVGRLEVDVVASRDVTLLGKATAYQAAYMHDDEAKQMVFEQIAVSQVGQFGTLTAFRGNDNHSPWVAPMAAMACANLSWRRTRSVRTGPAFPGKTLVDVWRTD